MRRATLSYSRRVIARGRPAPISSPGSRTRKTGQRYRQFNALEAASAVNFACMLRMLLIIQPLALLPDSICYQSTLPFYIRSMNQVCLGRWWFLCTLSPS
jgi:hypothetical protein